MCAGGSISALSMWGETMDQMFLRRCTISVCLSAQPSAQYTTTIKNVKHVMTQRMVYFSSGKVKSTIMDLAPLAVQVVSIAMLAIPCSASTNVKQASLEM